MHMSFLKTSDTYLPRLACFVPSLSDTALAATYAILVCFFVCLLASELVPSHPLFQYLIPGTVFLVRVL